MISRRFFDEKIHITLQQAKEIEKNTTAQRESSLYREKRKLRLGSSIFSILTTKMKVEEETNRKRTEETFVRNVMSASVVLEDH